MPTWDPDTFKEMVRTLHDTGLQISVHCGGDAAVDLVLDAYEEAQNANPRSDPRHRLEHAVITTPESTQRILDLGAVISTQPQFIRMAGDYYQEMLTQEQIDRVIMTREWLDAGVPMAISSDAPTTPWLEPQLTLATSMTRLTPSEVVMGDDQVLTNEEALRAHTITAAYVARDEATVGSVEAGKQADLAVWATDPLTAYPRDLYEATIDLTMVGGKIVYRGMGSPRVPSGRV
jgi:predicted amidohydrolase YtcJ